MGSIAFQQHNNQSDDLRKRKHAKPTCLDDCPEWDYIKDSKIGQIPIILNENISGPVRINDYNLNIMQTCAFDSIFQVVVSELLANKIYYKNLQSSDCLII